MGSVRGGSLIHSVTMVRSPLRGARQSRPPTGRTAGGEFCRGHLEKVKTHRRRTSLSPFFFLCFFVLDLCTPSASVPLRSSWSPPVSPRLNNRLQNLQEAVFLPLSTFFCLHIFFFPRLLFLSPFYSSTNPFASHARVGCSFYIGKKLPLCSSLYTWLAISSLITSGSASVLVSPNSYTREDESERESKPMYLGSLIMTLKQSSITIFSLRSLPPFLPPSLPLP